MNKFTLFNLFISFLIYSIFFCSETKSQNYHSMFVYDTSKVNYIQFSMDKYINTYLFRGDAFYQFNGILGDIIFFQNYTGNAIKSAITTFRDDQNLSINHSYKLNPILNLNSRANWMLSSDTRSIDLNKVEVIKGLTGLNIQPADLLQLSVSAGYETNRQLGINSKGFVYSMDASMDSFEFEQYKVNSFIRGELSNLDNDRTNSNLNFNLNVLSEYDDDNSLSFALKYLNTNSANFIPIRTAEITQFGVENRYKSHLLANLGLKFKIYDFNADITISASNRFEDKFFNRYFTQSSLTGINKRNHELHLSINSSVYYFSQSFFQSISLYIDHRNESFSLQNKFNIPLEEERMLSDLETQKNNILSTKRLYHNGKIYLSSKDTLQSSFSISLLQFDTPSSQNDDDYDKLMLLGSITYLHRFAKYLSGAVLLESQNIHQVNLKAKQSALNNWYRSLRLGTYFIYTLDGFKMQPRFDLIASYTIYDFEELLTNINSISFRQIGLRDSIYVKLSEQIYSNLIYIINYNERGILYWKEFSETPQKKNLEQFIKILFFYKISDRFTIAIGGRYYNLSQKSLTKIASGMSFMNTIYGPEVYFDLNLSRNSIIRFEGWGDLHSYNPIHSIRPNLYLKTIYYI